MTTRLFFTIFIFLLVQASTAQETQVNLSLGAGYTNQVYYKLSTETETEVAANTWDIAFLRTSSFDHGIRVNDGIGIQVFEVANSADQWSNIDITDQSAWTQLYNSDTDRQQGAFMNASATYGWGEYNPINHHIAGTIIFVLKYADDSYKKFICEDFYGGYSIKYASWNGTTWLDDKTAVIANSSNTDNNYNYYSLQNDAEVIVEPAATDWDFVFRKYNTDVGGGTMYPVTGVLLSDGVEVATATGDDVSNLNYLSEINTIGYNWKTLNASYQYEVNSEVKYYIKDDTGAIYKLYFTSFSGSSTGNLSFNIEDVTQVLSVEELGENVSFAVYPNPVGVNKKINIIFDVNQTNQSENNIEIYNLNGQKVLGAQLTNNQGFYNNEIDLSNLNSGVYMLKFTSGNYQKTKKIVIQ